MKNYGPGVCEWCGKSFSKATHNARFCGDEHRFNCVRCGDRFFFTGKPKNREKARLCVKCVAVVGAEKSRATRMRLHGSETYNNRTQAKSTMLARHGGKTTLESPSLRFLQEETMRSRYGHEYTMRGTRRIANGAARRKSTPADSMKVSELLNSERELLEFLEANKESILSATDLAAFLSIGPHEAYDAMCRYPSVRKRLKVRGSYLESIVMAFLSSEFSDAEVKRHFRSLPGGLELDFVVGNMIAFEVNDFATHSLDRDDEKVTHSLFSRVLETKHGPKYHAHKDKLAGEAGLRLVFLWENDILDGTFASTVREALR